MSQSRVIDFSNCNCENVPVTSMFMDSYELRDFSTTVEGGNTIATFLTDGAGIFSLTSFDALSMLLRGRDMFVNRVWIAGINGTELKYLMMADLSPDTFDKFNLQFMDITSLEFYMVDGSIERNIWIDDVQLRENVQATQTLALQNDNIVTTPEPSVGMLLMLGLLAVWFVRRLRS